MKNQKHQKKKRKHLAHKNQKRCIGKPILTQVSHPIQNLCFKFVKQAYYLVRS